MEHVMFANLSISTSPVRYLLIAAALVLVVPRASYAQPSSAACFRPLDLVAGQVARTVVSRGGEWLRFDAPAAGWVKIEISGAAESSLLSFWGFSCHANSADPLQIIERSPNALLARVDRPGSLLFRLSAADQRRELGVVKVHSSFLSLADHAAGVVQAKEGEDEDEIEIDAGGGAPQGLGGPVLSGSCIAPGDDHGDSRSCASLLDSAGLAAEISNRWGDDEDYYRINLGSPDGAQIWRLVVESTGDLDTVARLYNKQGQQIVFSDDDGEGSNFRLATALVSGTYYLRVAGRDGAEGAYGLRVDTSAW